MKVCSTDRKPCVCRNVCSVLRDFTKAGADGKSGILSGISACSFPTTRRECASSDLYPSPSKDQEWGLSKTKPNPAYPQIQNWIRIRSKSESESPCLGKDSPFRVSCKRSLGIMLRLNPVFSKVSSSTLQTYTRFRKYSEHKIRFSADFWVPGYIFLFSIWKKTFRSHPCETHIYFPPFIQFKK